MIYAVLVEARKILLTKLARFNRKLISYLRSRHFKWRSRHFEVDGFLPIQNRFAFCEAIQLETVPIEEVEDSFNYTVEALIERAKGKYPSGQNKERIVIRPQTPEYCYELGKSLLFKVINNDFLAKEK